MRFLIDSGNYIPRTYKGKMIKAVRAEGIYIYDEAGYNIGI